jgi:hypothetical protein
MFAQLLNDPKVFKNLVKRRFQMRYCHECAEPARLHYGHMHALDKDGDGIIVVAGHCDVHIKVPSGADAHTQARCVHKGAGCGGVRMFKPEELQTTWY